MPSKPWGCFSPFLTGIGVKCYSDHGVPPTRYLSGQSVPSFAVVITGIAGVLAIGLMLGIAEVSGHIGIEGASGDTRGQLLEQAALAEDVF